jgi:hypothetical protein
MTVRRPMRFYVDTNKEVGDVDHLPAQNSFRAGLQVPWKNCSCGVFGWKKMFASPVTLSTLPNRLSPFGLPAQPVDATQALNLSAGVSNCKVSRGRSFS